MTDVETQREGDRDGDVRGSSARRATRAVLARAGFASASFLFLSSAACSPSSTGGGVEMERESIVGGTPATAYPEAVIVTSDGFIPCSGAVLAPRVVLTAGHCRSATKTYAVAAPNAGNQQSTASSDWTTYNGDPATSSDTLLLFLDTPIVLTSYPQIASEPVANGTAVVDVGRTLNGSITSTDYVSPTVTIQGLGTGLGFPFNYEARPDISQDGDSGGPIELEADADAAPTHFIVGIVDTDTVEQDINEEEPIDLFARIDVVYSAIEAQIAAHASGDGGEEDAQAPDGGEQVAASAPPRSGGGCSVARGPREVPLLGVGSAAAVFVRRRRRRHAATEARSRFD